MTSNLGNSTDIKAVLAVIEKKKRLLTKDEFFILQQQAKEQITYDKYYSTYGSGRKNLTAVFFEFLPYHDASYSYDKENNVIVESLTYIGD